MPPLNALTMFLQKAQNSVKNKWIVTQIELDMCFDIINQHAKYEWNPFRSFKLLSEHQILITGTRTGVSLHALPPFFKWRVHK